MSRDASFRVDVWWAYAGGTRQRRLSVAARVGEECGNYHVCRDLYILKINKKKAERKDMPYLCNRIGR
jgi:hypothetical protein